MTPPPPSKGDQTRTQILEAGIAMAASEGLEALSIGRLADRVGLSKSGLFAHFRSKEALQLAVLAAARERFLAEVWIPALKAPRGEPRLLALFEKLWAWARATGREGGCVFLQAAAEFDDRDGSVRNALVEYQREWLASLTEAARLAVAEGHFRADLNPRQFAFQVQSAHLGAHFYYRLMRDPKTLDHVRQTLAELLAGARSAPTADPSS